MPLSPRQRLHSSIPPAGANGQAKQAPPGLAPPLPLRPDDLAELRASGLSDETIRNNAIYTERDPLKVARILNRRGTAESPAGVPDYCHGGMVYPHFDATGNRNCYATVKPHNPRTKDGKIRKYEVPLHEPPHAYISPGCRARLKEGVREVLIVEGIKKALAAQEVGYAAISINGVDCWKARDNDILPELAAIDWKGKVVYIVFDCDSKPETRRNVTAAARRLAGALRKLGAEDCRYTQPPHGKDNAKNGLDDYLVGFPRHRRAVVLRELLDAAPPINGCLANYYVKPGKDTEGKDATIKVGRTSAQIQEDLLRITDGWPKRVDRLLFATRDDEPLWLVGTSDLFAYIGAQLLQPVQWVKGEDKVTQSVFHAHLQQQAENFKAVEAFPHCPPIPGHYYLHPEPQRGDGAALRNLLARFCPASPADGQLIKAAFLTLLWGGEPGSRPAFLIEADEKVDQGGRGPGKSTLAKMAARLVGGHLAIRSTDDYNRTMNRLLSPSTLTKRVALLDNVKTLRFSWADLEALVTEAHINGYQLYVGDASRPNTLTWFITMNGANMSKDMAQRCVPVKVARPEYSATWEEETNRWIDENRWAIVGDLLAVLAGPKTELPTYTRWGSWERSVLACVDEPEECQVLIAERQAAIDGDQEDADMVREALIAAMRDKQHNPDTDVVFIPSKEVAKIVNEAEGEINRKPQQVTTHLLSLHIKEMRKTNRSDMGGRGWVWAGQASTSTTEVVLFGAACSEYLNIVKKRLNADLHAHLRAETAQE